MSRSRRLHIAVTAVGGLAVIAVLATTQPSGAATTAAISRSAIARSADSARQAGLASQARQARPDGTGDSSRVPATGPQFVAAYAADLANGLTGKMIWGRRQYGARPIASITKVMTALVVIRSGNLGRRITITQADENYVCCGIQGAGLKVGDVLTAQQLLYAMLLPSGADAALALADSYGPGWPAFVRKMNATAAKLGLLMTHFTNFDGVDSTDVSSPRNLLMLGEAAMTNVAFRDVVKRRWYYLAAAPGHHRYFWKNTNLLLAEYPGVIGIKTGWTPAAGECLLFEAIHNKSVLIGVVLDSAPTKTGQSFIDAARMLNWGFGLHVPLPARQRAGRIPFE